MNELESNAKQIVDAGREGDGFKLNDLFNSVAIKDWPQLANMAREENARTMLEGLPKLKIDAYPETVTTTILNVDYSDKNHEEQVILDRYVDTNTGEDLETPVITKTK